MPTLFLRRVGMSYMIEGLIDPELDPARLLNDLTLSFGAAVVAMNANDQAVGSITSILVDCKVETWEGIQQAILTALRTQGFKYLDWAPSITGGTHALRLHVFR